MTFEEFEKMIEQKPAFKEFEKMIGHQPAKISATLDDKSNAKLNFEGRGIELMALSMQIAKEVMIRTHTDVDSYCRMLKEGCRGKECSSYDDEEIKKALNKLMEDLFK